jgi:putative redox protein
MKIKLERLNDQIAFSATNEAGIVACFDGNPEIGGENKGLRPMEMLVSCLASCASIDVLLILKKKKISLNTYFVEIEATRKEEYPKDFKAINLVFIIGENDPLPQVEKVVKLSVEKYCSVYSSLNKEIKISYETRFEEK